MLDCTENQDDFDRSGVDAQGGEEPGDEQGTVQDDFARAGDPEAGQEHDPG